MPSLSGELLYEQATGAPRPGTPAAMTGAVVLRHRQVNEGRKLFGLAEIGVGGLGQRLAFEWHHALIALHLAAAIDGHGEMALTKQLRQVAIAARGADTISGEARIAA